MNTKSAFIPVVGRIDPVIKPLLAGEPVTEARGEKPDKYGSRDGMLQLEKLRGPSKGFRRLYGSVKV
jgi:hypothetical protein